MPAHRRYSGIIDAREWHGGENISFDKAEVRGLDLQGRRFWNLSASDAHFVDCDFRGTSFESGSWLGKYQTTFVRCRFEGADLRSIIPGNCRFEGCDFSGALIDDWLTQAAEFVECRFAGRIKEARFAGRPWGLWEEPGQILPPRSSNQFRKNDFREAELLGCDFAWGIDIGDQRWPTGPEYVRVDRWGERLARAREAFETWPADDRREARIILEVYSAPGYEFQEEIFVNKYDGSTPRDVADRIWESIASVLPK
jgi:Pentapeptide repeats (8 copies)